MYIDPYEVGVFPMVSLSHIGEWGEERGKLLERVEGGTQKQGY
jgi:hypothetical protein